MNLIDSKFSFTLENGTSVTLELNKDFYIGWTGFA
jgi:hypothetical protein